ncbi:hypothetical protein C8R46DRAFT_1125893 [Mycena filopes]|nr:hypothetical protein C8R46DRAFT_1125893 [Mycena filopes]
MSLHPATPPTDAAIPFSGASGNDAHAPDFIIRSSDGVDFHLHRDILKFASVCFDGMLASPPGEDDLERDGKPVVVVPEEESVLYRLFSLAYPPLSPSDLTLGTEDLDDVVAVHRAAHKYQFMRVLQFLAAMLDNPSLIDAAPHRLFAIGRLCDLPTVARKAALSTLKHHMYPTPIFPEMHLLTWADARPLSDFYHLCAAEASRRLTSSKGASGIGTDELRSREVLLINGLLYPQSIKDRRRFVWWSDSHKNECTRETHSGVLGSTSWFRNHIASIAERVGQRPSSHTILTAIGKISRSDQEIIDTCSSCSMYAKRHLAELANVLARAHDKFSTARAEEMF